MPDLSSDSPSVKPADDWEMIFQGAEARVWKLPSTNPPQVVKERFAKKYRHPILDARLTKQRCKAEARLLEKCKKIGLDVPQVIRVDAPVIYLEWIDGHSVRQELQNHLPKCGEGSLEENGKESESVAVTEEIAVSMGIMIGTLHSQGIIHGDLTTSNVMLRSPTQNKDGALRLVLIDFGLARNSTSAEERAVDLYVLERALISTHPTLPDSFWSTLMQHYLENAGDKKEHTMSRLEQVRQRGRKRECFG